MYNEQLMELKKYFETGATKSLEFRKQQLMLLKKAIKKYELEIAEALYKDLKKSPEESYATEIGLVINEINYAIKNLSGWMHPQKVPTNFLNLPSSSKIYKDALGVVLIIAPWNYPFQLLFAPLIGAMAGGNCVVLKPSEFAVETCATAAKICREIFDENYVLLVQGDGEVVVKTMLQSFIFNHVFYTGSIGVGKIIYAMAAENLVPVTLELGGKSPCVVEFDANIKVAAQRIAMGKFVNVGQTCIAPDYVLVHASVKDELVKEMKIAIEKFYTNDASSSYDYGKIINQKRFDKLLSYLKDGTIVFGGNHDKETLFIAPTLLENVSLQSPMMQEEIFGPLLPIIVYETREAALQIIEQHKNPLAFYLFTTNKKSEIFWMDALPFGGGCINNTIYQFANNNLPFGGVGNSGLGAYHGKFSFDIFTRNKPVLKTPNWFNPSVKYPSFKGKLKLFRWMFE